MKLRDLAILGGFFFVLTAPAHALTMAECSDKYQAAKADGSATGVKWNDFRKAQCGADAKPAAEVVVDEPNMAADDAPEPAAPAKKAPKGVTFPSAISAKYKAESAGKARMHTCVDSYHVNKDAGTLNGLKWIQKGGGYYSLCNAKLKS